MKASILTFLILFFAISKYCQNEVTSTKLEVKEYPAEKDTTFDQGSGITSVLVDKNQIGNLKTLGLIWGFLKYYHPNIAKGAYNWDYELFRILPKVLHSDNKSNLDSILVKWINGLGDFPQGKNNIIKAAEVKIEPDLDWIKDSGFSDELRAILLKVKNANRSQEHYYIGLKEGTKNPDFKNENAYPSMKYPDLGFRLLTLYRYWNIIQYYFPYKNLIEEDWKNVLEEFIPKFIASKDEKEYTLVTLELIGRVYDTHANIWGGNQVLKDHFGLRYACVGLTFIDDKPVVKDFYDEQRGKETGLEIGDIISVVNNRPVEEHRKNTIELDSKNGNLKSSQVFESIFNTAFEEIEPKISLAFPTLSNETIKSETFKNEISQTEERNLENLLPLPKNEVKILFENSVPAPIIYPRRHVAFNIIFFAGGGLSKLSYTTKSTDYQHLTKMNNSEKGMEFLNIGIATDIRITSKWSVNTGIRYSRWVTQINNISSQSTPFEKEGIVEIVIDEQGSETNFTGKTQGITEKSVVQKWHTFHHQLEVPVQLRYKLFKVNNHQISLAGGTMIPLISKTNGGYLSQEDKLVKFENESSPFISQKTSWNGGLVWEWALRPEWSLQTGVLYEQKTFVLKDINTEINKNMAAFYLSLGCKRKF